MWHLYKRNPLLGDRQAVPSNYKPSRSSHQNTHNTNSCIMVHSWCLQQHDDLMPGPRKHLWTKCWINNIFTRFSVLLQVRCRKTQGRPGTTRAASPQGSRRVPLCAAYGIEEHQEEEQEEEEEEGEEGDTFCHHCLGGHRQLGLLCYAVDHLLSLLEDSLVHLLQGRRTVQNCG